MPRVPEPAELDEALALATPPLGRRLLPWLVLVAVASAVAAGAWAIATREVPLEVDVFIVGRGDVERTVPSVSAGRIVARRRARVAADVIGRVVAVRARKGDRATKGQPIVELDDQEARAALAQTEGAYKGAIAAVAEAEARLATLRIERDRRVKLLQGDAATQEIVDRASMEAAVAEASLAVARARTSEVAARVESARAYLAKHVVRAPFDGVVSEVWVETGESTSAAGAGAGGGKAQAALAMTSTSRLFELIALDDLYVTAPIDEVDLGRVTAGLEARVTLDPWPKEPFQGKVVRLAPYVLDVEEQNRTVELEVDVPEAWRTRGLRPGTSADVEVVVERHEGVLRVPAHALHEGGKALVVEPDETGRERAVERLVETGLENWRWAEVRAGVREGARVIGGAAAGARAKAGALVRVRGTLEHEPRRAGAPPGVR